MKMDIEIDSDTAYRWREMEKTRCVKGGKLGRKRRKCVGEKRREEIKEGE